MIIEKKIILKNNIENKSLESTQVNLINLPPVIWDRDKKKSYIKKKMKNKEKEMLEKKLKLTWLTWLIRTRNDTTERKVKKSQSSWINNSISNDEIEKKNLIKNQEKNLG